MNQTASAPLEPTTEDEREYARFAAEQDPIDLAAATWVARQRNGLDAAGAQALQDWLTEDPAHQTAYDDMNGTFDQLLDLPEHDVRALKALLDPTPPLATVSPVTAPQPMGAPARPASPERRFWLLAAGRWVPQATLAALAVGTVGGGWLGWSHWWQQPSFEHSYATARGQQLETRLPDGSTLLLDTATNAEVRLFRDRREVLLRDGQAEFNVQADAGRPFHVTAGGVRVTVVGTRFSVRHTRTGLGDGATQVAVEHGHVRVVCMAGPGVANATDAGRSVDLHAGQTVAMDEQGQWTAVANVPPAATAPWRDGRVSFDNIPLGQALAEFERYGSTGLVVRDPAVAALRVGGSFRLKNFTHFRESLTAQLPVRLEAREGGMTEVVRAR